MLGAGREGYLTLSCGAEEVTLVQLRFVRHFLCAGNGMDVGDTVEEKSVVLVLTEPVVKAETEG